LIKRISNWLYLVSSGWVVLGALLVFTLFTILVLPGQAASAEAVSADAGSPDLSFYYSADELYRMAESYGQAGRDAYIRARFTFDLVWPGVYTLFLITSVSWIYARAFPQDFKFWWVNLLPLLGMVFDYLENISTSLVMFRYPHQTPLVDFLAPIFTMLKWVLITGSFFILVVGVIILIIQKIIPK
jgi:hypothetical protein